MRVSLFLVTLASLVAATSAALFTQRPQSSIPWNPRVLQGLAFPTTAFTYTNTAGAPITVPANNSNVIAYGGGKYNDSYFSSDSGNTWNLYGGIGASVNPTTGKTAYTASAHPASFNCDDNDCCKAYDVSTNTFYVVDSYTAYYSTNGHDWTVANANEFTYRQSIYCPIDTTTHTLYLIGGQNSSSSLYENDVWTSTNTAQSFNQRSTAPWSQRDSQNGWVHTAPAALGSKQVLYAIGGHAAIENSRPNEVWVSSDSGASWTLLSYGAFLGRDHFGAAITSTGVMLVVGGKLNATNPAGSHLGANDVWASLDGGATFGSCGTAEFPVRQDHRFAISNDGYLYVSGGTSINSTGPTTTLGDLWVSTMSYNSVSAVASQCGLVVPQCGVGLRCWPNATVSYMNVSSSGISYPSPTIAAYNCPCNGVVVGVSSSSSTGSIGGAMVASQVGAVVPLVMLVSAVVALFAL